VSKTNVVLMVSENLRLVFDRRGDRWGHRIELLREGRLVATLSSIEGAATDDWPPSPAFQNVDVQAIAGNGKTALLVGKAGSSHWSAAIEADPAAGALDFDIACRFGDEPRLLGSIYAIVCEASNSISCLPRINLPEIADGCRRTVDAAGDRLTIRILPPPGPLPRTVRWQYIVSEGQLR
jgi:hypothetical protein